MNKTESKELTIYHYSFSDLRKFIEHGRAEGNNGMILTEIRNGFHVYRGYGTIEKPCRNLITLSMKHNPLFDSSPITVEPASYRYKVIDFGKGGK